MDEWAKRSSCSLFHSSFSVFPLLRCPRSFLSILLFNIISFPFTFFHIFFPFNCPCFLSDPSLVYCSARLSRLFHPAKCSSTRYRLKTSPVIMIKFHVTKGQDDAENITQASLSPVHQYQYRSGNLQPALSADSHLRFKAVNKYSLGNDHVVPDFRNINHTQSVHPESSPKTKLPAGIWAANVVTLLLSSNKNHGHTGSRTSCCLHVGDLLGLLCNMFFMWFV